MLLSLLFPGTSSASEEGSVSSSTTSFAALMHELDLLGRAWTSSTATTAISEEGLELFDAAPEVAPPPAAPPVEEKVTIPLLYTGGSRGLGFDRYNFDLVFRLDQLVRPEGGVVSARVFHGVLVQGTAILVAPDQRLETLVRFLTTGPISCGWAGEAWSVRTRSERLLVRIPHRVLVPSNLPEWLRALNRERKNREYDARQCRSDAGAEAILFTPRDGIFSPPRWSLEEFEIRRGLAVDLTDHGAAVHVDLIGIPSNEAARRFHLLDLLTRESPQPLFIDAGSFVDGSARLGAGSLSEYRPLAFEILTRLRPAALVPGATELEGGGARFLAEARGAGLDYVATNWRSLSPGSTLPRSIVRELQLGTARIRIAFLGVIDPALADRVPELAKEKITLIDPVTAIQEEVRELSARGARPELIVLLTNASRAFLSQLEQQPTGVDLVIGGDAAASAQVQELKVELQPDVAHDGPPAAVLPIRSVNRVDVQLVRTDGRWVPRSIHLRFLPTTEELQPDPRVMSELTLARSRTLTALDYPILAAKRASPLGTLSNAEWRTLVCEAARRGTGADVALLPDLPEIERLPGPLTAALISDRLSVLDHLVSDDVAGGDLVDLLREASKPSVAIACGGETGRPAPRLGGRPILPWRTYRLLTTDRALLLGLGEKLERAHAGRVFERRPSRLMRGKDEPLTLRSAVLDYLRSGLERAGGPVPVEPLIEDGRTPAPPAWFFELTRGAFEVELFRGAGDPGYSLVPETLVTNPSSSSVGIAVDAAISYESARLHADMLLKARHHRLMVARAEAQELEDDLRLSSSGSLPGLSLPTGPLAWMPYLELLLDSEFTPVEQDGARLPRQADLSLTAGLSSQAGFLSRVRAGAFVQHDVSRFDRPIELGGKAELHLKVDLSSPIRLTTDLEGTLFAPNMRDDASGLRFKILLENRLAIPLARFLDIATYLQLFTFKGRVPETDTVRVSYLFGFSLEAHTAFQL